MDLNNVKGYYSVGKKKNLCNQNSKIEAELLLATPAKNQYLRRSPLPRGYSLYVDFGQQDVSSSEQKALC